MAARGEAIGPNRLAAAGSAAGETKAAYTVLSRAAAGPGYIGQCEGALKAGPWPASIAAICIAMAQWWAPFRRQQAGRRASSLAGSTAVSGPRPKNRTRKAVNACRIYLHDTRGRS
ncbi:MAG: hypothetical protein ACLGP3_02510, partial [Acidobacteriota bacterium]